MGRETDIVRSLNGQAGKCWPLDLTMHAITKYGHGIFLLYGLWLWFSGKDEVECRHHRGSCIRVFLAILAASSLSFIIGKAWNRKRPFLDDWYIWNFTGHRDTPSFPSNHTMNSMIVIFQLWHDKLPFRRGLSIFALILSFSRVYAGVHYVSDLLGGVCIAAFMHRLWNRKFWRRGIISFLERYDRVHTYAFRRRE